MHQDVRYFRIYSMDKLKPTEELRHNILSAIRQTECRRAKFHLLVYFSVIVVSLSGVFLSLQYMSQEFYKSGFYEYLSLLFSSNIVYTYWRELSLSLIDSMPIIGIIAFLTTLGFLVWSGANAFTNTRRFILQNN